MNRAVMGYLSGQGGAILSARDTGFVPQYTDHALVFFNI